MAKANNLWKQQLSNDTRDFWVDYQIKRINKCSQLQFCKEAYSRYHPVILTGMIDHWPALQKWNEQYFSNTLKEKKISVNLTLEGMADSIQLLDYENKLQEYFLYPADVQMPIHEFFELLFKYYPNKGPGTIIPYLSQQNDNLRKEFPELMKDIDMNFPLAEIFDSPEPEAVNLWIGDERSISSIHKDHFENFYFVVSGEKTFTLFPPTDAAYFPENPYPALKYKPVYENNEIINLELTKENCPTESLSWISIDPNDYLEDGDYDYEGCPWPDRKYANPLTVTVNAGEILYIPAMWYHRVSQNELTVAVNMWYDQRFDFR